MEESFLVIFRWFTHFYIWGLAWIWSVSFVFFSTCLFQSSSPPVPLLDAVVSFVTGGYLQQQCWGVPLGQHHVDTAVVLSMLSLQVARRLCECLFVSVFADSSKIHLLHYALGLFFYPAVAFTALLHLDNTSGELKVFSLFYSLSFSLFLDFDAPFFPRWYHVISLSLFLWASYHQHVCHRILASLRRPPEQQQEETMRAKCKALYARPDGDWFELVSCPHFLAEVVIYVAVCLCCVATAPLTCWWLVVGYVGLTLGLSARQTHVWYHRRFPHYPKHRRAIIPWIC